ncbi:MAG TPA: PilN domain-containing protein [bacterium]
MLNINLLPANMQKAGPSSIEQFYRAPLLWVVLAGMIVWAVGLLGLVGYRHRELAVLEGKVQELAPQRAVVDQLRQFVEQLKRLQTAYAKLGSSGFEWSRRVDAMVELTPDGMWFTDFTFDDKKGFSLEGLAMERSGTEMGAIGRLVQDFQQHPSFSAKFKDIQIDSIKRVQDQDVELVRFLITGSLVEAPAS